MRVQLSRRNARRARIALLVTSLPLYGCAPTIDQFVSKWTPIPTPEANSAAAGPGATQAKTTPWQGPAVQVLVNHITCQMIKEYQHNSTAWANLKRYNFVAAIDLTLSVTDSQSLNPSLGFVSLLQADGAPLHPVITEPNAKGIALSPTTFSRTLTVGGQLGATQTQSISLDYQLDMGRITAAPYVKPLVTSGYEHDEAAQDQVTQINNDVRVSTDSIYELSKNVSGVCNGDNREGVAQAFKGDLLQGDLGLKSTITDGLGTIDTVQFYSVYGTSGPALPTDVTGTPSGVGQINPKDNAQLTAAKTLDADKIAQVLNASPSAGQVAAFVSPRPTPTPPAGAAPKPASANIAPASVIPAPPMSFSASVTFDLVASINGGPNWTLQLFKGPSGGGGGASGGMGGAAGGASGSGAGAGGGSGGGGQLLNFSRVGLDTLTITFTPTCKSNAEFPLVVYSDTMLPDPDGSSAPAPGARSGDTSTPMERVLKGYTWTNVPVEVDPTASGSSTSAQEPPGSGQEAATHSAIRYWLDLHLSKYKKIAGVTSGSGYVLMSINADGRDPRGTPIDWTSRNFGPKSVVIITVRSPDANAKWGLISLSNAGLPQEKLGGRVTDDVISKLEHEGPTVSYWDTVPGCDAVTGTDIQAAVANAIAQTQILRIQPPSRR